jgi:hypothetical protein
VESMAFSPARSRLVAARRAGCVLNGRVAERLPLERDGPRCQRCGVDLPRSPILQTSHLSSNPLPGNRRRAQRGERRRRRRPVVLGVSGRSPDQGGS